MTVSIKFLADKVVVYNNSTPIMEGLPAAENWEKYLYLDWPEMGQPFGNKLNTVIDNENMAVTQTYEHVNVIQKFRLSSPTIFLDTTITNNGTKPINVPGICMIPLLNNENVDKDNSLYDEWIFNSGAGYKIFTGVRFWKRITGGYLLFNKTTGSRTTPSYGIGFSLAEKFPTHLWNMRWTWINFDQQIGYRQICIYLWKPILPGQTVTIKTRYLVTNTTTWQSLLSCHKKCLTDLYGKPSNNYIKDTRNILMGQRPDQSRIGTQPPISGNGPYGEYGAYSSEPEATNYHNAMVSKLADPARNFQGKLDWNFVAYKGTEWYMANSLDVESTVLEKIMRHENAIKQLGLKAGYLTRGDIQPEWSRTGRNLLAPPSKEFEHQFFKNVPDFAYIDSFGIGSEIQYNVGYEGQVLWNLRKERGPNAQFFVEHILDYTAFYMQAYIYCDVWADRSSPANANVAPFGRKQYEMIRWLTDGHFHGMVYGLDLESRKVVAENMGSACGIADYEV